MRSGSYWRCKSWSVPMCKRAQECPEQFFFLANVIQTGGNCKNALKSKTFITALMHITQLWMSCKPAFVIDCAPLFVLMIHPEMFHVHPSGKIHQPTVVWHCLLHKWTSPFYFHLFWVVVGWFILVNQTLLNICRDSPQTLIYVLFVISANGLNTLR